MYNKYINKREKYFGKQGEDMGDVIVSMEHITKEFPGVKALDDVKFNLRAGEVMALR